MYVDVHMYIVVYWNLYLVDLLNTTMLFNNLYYNETTEKTLKYHWLCMQCEISWLSPGTKAEGVYKTYVHVQVSFYACIGLYLYNACYKCRPVFWEVVW